MFLASTWLSLKLPGCLILHSPAPSESLCPWCSKADPVSLTSHHSNSAFRSCRSRQSIWNVRWRTPLQITSSQAISLKQWDSNKLLFSHLITSYKSPRLHTDYVYKDWRKKKAFTMFILCLYVLWRNMIGCFINFKTFQGGKMHWDDIQVRK